jgi:pimeloyl-ACP methyl ester carboxylesterase
MKGLVGTPQTLWVAGTRVKVKTMGEGPPLLLIMGIGGSMDMWEPLEQALPGRTLIMFDFPGTGSSGSPLFPPTIPHSALFVRLLLCQLHLGQVDVLGYSWGGLVAQQLAIQHRRVVRKLILASTSFGLGSVPPRLRVAATMATPRRYYSESNFKRIAARTFGGEFRSNLALVDAESRRRLGRPPSLLGYTWQVLASASYSSLLLLPTVRAETLVLAGSDDPIIRRTNSCIMAGVIPRSRLQVVDGAGHLLLLERTPAATDLIESFLSDDERCSAGPGRSEEP